MKSGIRELSKRQKFSRSHHQLITFDLSSSQEENLLSAAVAPKTRVATDFWVRTVQSFLREKKTALDLRTCTSEEVNDGLKGFYFGLRKKTGGMYQASSYVSARSAIQRHLTSLKPSFNIRDDKEFMTSNNSLDAVLKRNKAELGESKPVQHKESITEAEKVRLNECFEDVLDSDDTYKLQSYCWFNIARHYGLRGGEVFSKLTRQDLLFKEDDQDKEYVVLRSDFLTKNTPSLVV